MSLHALLSELKRRQVYRAAIVYATVAWALLESADIIFPRLGFGDQSVTLVLTLAIVGFPVAIYLAWVYDITPEGIYRTPPSSEGIKHSFSWARITEFLVIAALVTTVGALYLERLALQEKLAEHETADSPSSKSAHTRSLDSAEYSAIAVLPFTDMSEAGDQSWFAEGIAEELLIALSKIDGLNVVARTSSFAFKDSDKTIADIAEILGVQALLEGSVRRIEDQVRITAQLIDTNTGYRIWAGSYQREFADIFKLQNELALSVVQALRLKLRLGPKGQLISEQTKSAEAYNWFIRGRALFDWSNAETHLRSIEYFDRAVAADPRYALAWGHLGYAQALSVLWRPIDEVYPLARAAYDHALALDPDQSEALAARALVNMVKNFDWEAGGRDLQPAVHAGSTVALWAYSVMLLPALDRLEESIHLQQLAEQQDPLHPGSKAAQAIYLLWSGRAEEAIAKAHQALELESGHLYALAALIEGYTSVGQYELAEQTIRNVPEALRQHPSITARVGLYFAAKGDENRAREILQSCIRSKPQVSPLIVSDLALQLGELEQAFDLMQHAADEHSWTAFWIRIRYRDNTLIQDNPRYLALLEQIGLDDASVKELQVKLSL